MACDSRSAALPAARRGRARGILRAMSDRNVLGEELEPCGTDPVTGFYRDGCCTTGPEDVGSHTICAVVTAEFLARQGGRAGRRAAGRGPAVAWWTGEQRRDAGRGVADQP